MVKHDELRDQLFRVYPPKPRSCAYCGEVTKFPDGIAKKEHSYRTPTGALVRPDISIRDGPNLVATLEVIDTNLSEAAFEAERGIRNAFFFHVGGGFWCSPECYQWARGRGPGSVDMVVTKEGIVMSLPRSDEGLLRVMPLPKCIDCQRLMIETAYPDIELADWDAADSPVCIECAVQHLESQYVSPGEAMAGASLWSGPKSLEQRFMALATSYFWAKVWCNRTKELNQAWSDETATQEALDSIEVHFVAGYREYGATLLASIGAPLWSADRDDAKPLYAWDPANCLRTAKAWVRLYEYRVGQMPDDLRQLIPEHNLEPCLEPFAECRLCGQSTKNARTKEHPYVICDACEEAQKEKEARRKEREDSLRPWREEEEARIRRSENMLTELRKQDPP